MKTHFFDVTDIALYVEKETSVSGIQRVSFEVIKRMVETHGTETVKLSYWDRAKRDYVSIPSDFIADMDEFDPDILSAVFFGRAARPRKETPPTLERYRNRPMKYWFHYLRSTFHAARGNEAHFTKHNSSIEGWRNFKAGITTETEPEPKSYDMPRTQLTQIAQKGDRLVVLGATWDIDGLDACFQGLADKQGVEISQLIHDLIPIITPEHIAGDFSQEFYRWLKTSTGYCSSYFANSANTATDLAAFMEEIGEQRPIQTVPLAQEFTLVEPKKQHVMSGPAGEYKSRVTRTLGLRREILNLGKVPFVLVVGTMESRKNIWRLAQAWQRMTQEEGLDLPKLVFAGKPGWYNDDFNQLIRASGNLGGWVQFADKPNDTELAWLYETCEFTAMVSFYEGWGLPIGESLSFGKTAVVANNSSMPEVGGDMVEYCDAHSLDSMHAACRKLIADPEHRAMLERRIADTRLRTWKDVTEDFVRLLSDGQPAQP
ncbi:Glycosyl transferase, group 1 [Sulfitobacter noctilucicola]|uniref:Glycosyltransferase involved in cell wall biosynthesis n=1 Tax=Sulfitobacter noctilucicola TaxID=1342301 RepID=A0A7W6MDH2_9RHOB|nr:glycosyltransferase family 1 protein [Sulfitobacter noctilucicola]KIN69837.1 Glycosyl transferase, group 1 [Sulfitobacter noctilucicola]MBB4176207.1 glycosyltransferase involved in cell wall biosynthesis [Sulfitobacter noctilucicola]